MINEPPTVAGGQYLKRDMHQVAIGGDHETLPAVQCCDQLVKYGSSQPGSYGICFLQLAQGGPIIHN